MEHDERMASISLKKGKYELRFASTPTHGSGSPAPSESAEDKQIQILRLQIRLAELTGGYGMGFPSSYPATTCHESDVSLVLIFLTLTRLTALNG
jgi:hypothetical protein